MRRLLLTMLTTLTVFLVATLVAGLGRQELELYKTPRPLPRISFADAAGRQIDLGSFAGKVVVLDFWATWCPPCRAEFPSLDHLQQQLGGENLVVIPVSMDRKGMPAVDRFYEDLKVRNLGKYLDEDGEAAQAIGIRGLPTTLVIDQHGREIGRVEGPAQWDGKAIADALQSVMKR